MPLSFENLVGVNLLIVASLLVCVTGAWAATMQSMPQANTESVEGRLLGTAERQPQSFQAAAALGEYYFRAKKWQKSAHWLARAVELNDNDSATGYDLAYAWIESGELEKAKKQLEHMGTHDDSARLHSLLGEVDDRRGDYVSAAREYHRAAEMDQSESTIFDLATFLLQHKKYVGFLEDSIKFYRYGVAQFPRSSRMLVGLGVALYANQQYDEAVRIFCQAIDRDPKDVRPVQFLGRASRVSAALVPEVDRRLKDFAERYPGNAATNYFYALSLWERGGGEHGRNGETIEKLLKRAESLSPAWYEPHYQLGVLYESENRYVDALSEMKRAVRIDPEFFPAHYRLAVLYKKLGERDEAAAEAAMVKRLKERDNEDAASHDVSP